ncbi:polyprenyl synthetase family protein [Candidatus Kaiserbacteria bacterium]|nr:polyprenyl synthetase family protein [Candidatus Kaiserbacteria bacterium]
MSAEIERSETLRPITFEKWASSHQKKLIDGALDSVARRLFPEPYPRHFALRHRLSQGKRLRPFLLFATSKGSTQEKLLVELATGIELIHQASLIFDDAIDEHTLRAGGRLSVHEWFKDGHERLASAAMSDLIATYLLSVHDKNIENLRISESKKGLIRISALDTKERMIQGQFADRIITQKPSHLSWTNWCLSQAYQKTSALMSYPLDISAILQNLDPPGRAQMKQTGEALGRLYQLYDDLDDLNTKPPYKAGDAIELSYPVAWLAKNKNERMPQDYPLPGIEMDLVAQQVLPEHVETLNELLTENKAAILESARPLISNFMTSIRLPEGVLGMVEIEKIISSVPSLVQSSRTELAG